MRVLTALMIVTLLSLADGATGQERPKITSISHIAVYTTDPAKTQSFYVHELGAVKGPDPENPAGVRYYFSSAQFVEVLPLPAGPTSVNRLDHAAFNTSDTGTMRKYLHAQGVEVPSAVTIASDGSQYFEVKDPEGNKIQFVQPAARPDVDAIFGIPPTVAIEQRTSRGGRKSTVATLTEIYHFLRLLYVKLGTQHCPDCNVPIEPQSAASIAGTATAN